MSKIQEIINKEDRKTVFYNSANLMYRAARRSQANARAARRAAAAKRTATAAAVTRKAAHS